MCKSDLLEDKQYTGKRAPMRCVGSVKAVVKYLESIDCPMLESTIYRLVRGKTSTSRRQKVRISILMRQIYITIHYLRVKL